MARHKLREGDVFLIPLAEGRYAVCKTLWLSAYWRNMVLVGASTKATVDKETMPKPVPPYDVRFYTGSELIGTHWPLVGHDDAAIDPDVSRRVCIGMVCLRDERLHEASPEEAESLPHQLIRGSGSVVTLLQKKFGLPRCEVPTKPRAPAAKLVPMDDERFWSMIEDAWKAAPKEAKLRPTGAKRPSQDTLEKVDHGLESRVLGALRRALRGLPADELAKFDRALEKKLFDLDRAEVQKHTGGSDDGFLYERGFIVAMGRAYYDAVNAKPSTAVMDMECEKICYLPKRIYEEMHDTLPPSGISRETGSNKAGWR